MATKIWSLTYVWLVEIDFVGELLSDLEESMGAPVSKPVQHTPTKKNIIANQL